MEILANSYFGNGLYTPSTYIYKKLQEIYEGDPATCDWQGRIVVNTPGTTMDRAKELLHQYRIEKLIVNINSRIYARMHKLLATVAAVGEMRGRRQPVEGSLEGVR